MTNGNQPPQLDAKPKRVEHHLIPGFAMEVLDEDDCETDSARPEPHKQYKVIDPEGNEDWLCGYDVRVMA